MIDRRRVLSLLAGAGAAGLHAGAGIGALAATSGAPQRIVSVGGAVTETVFALGFGDRVAAADTTSVYPAAAAALPKVGYLRQLSSEGVLAMRPDLVLLGAGAGPAAAVSQIKASSVPVREIDAPMTPEGVGMLVRSTGAALGATERADDLADEIDRRFATLAASLPGEDAPSVLLVLSAGAGPLLGAGSDTAASALIGLAGGRLALPGLEGYRPISLEPVLAADPDWIVVPDHVVTALGGPEGLKRVDVVSATRAGREGRVIVADSLYLLGFGPRTPQAAADLATLLHPGARIPLLGRPEAPSGLVGTVAS